MHIVTRKLVFVCMYVSVAKLAYGMLIVRANKQDPSVSRQLDLGNNITICMFCDFMRLNRGPTA